MADVQDRDRDQEVDCLYRQRAHRPEPQPSASGLIGSGPPKWLLPFLLGAATRRITLLGARMLAQCRIRHSLQRRDFQKPVTPKGPLPVCNLPARLSGRSSREPSVLACTRHVTVSIERVIIGVFSGAMRCRFLAATPTDSIADAETVFAESVATVDVRAVSAGSKDT